MNGRPALHTGVTIVALALACTAFQFCAQTVIDPAKMPKIGTVDSRFAYYNIEMAEVTGGNFWKPYSSKPQAAQPVTKREQSSSTPAGVNPNISIANAGNPNCR